MKIVLTQPLYNGDTQLATAGQALDLDDATATDLIAAGRATAAPEAAPAAKENQQAARRHTKPAPGPTKTK